MAYKMRKQDGFMKKQHSFYLHFDCGNRCYFWTVDFYNSSVSFLYTTVCMQIYKQPKLFLTTILYTKITIMHMVMSRHLHLTSDSLLVSLFTCHAHKG